MMSIQTVADVGRTGGDLSCSSVRSFHRPVVPSGRSPRRWGVHRQPSAARSAATVDMTRIVQRRQIRLPGIGRRLSAECQPDSGRFLTVDKFCLGSKFYRHPEVEAMAIAHNPNLLTVR